MKRVFLSFCIGIYPKSKLLLKITNSRGRLTGTDLCSSGGEISYGLFDLQGSKDDTGRTNFSPFIIETIINVGLVDIFIYLIRFPEI